MPEVVIVLKDNTIIRADLTQAQINHLISLRANFPNTHLVNLTTSNNIQVNSDSLPDSENTNTYQGVAFYAHNVKGITY